MALFDRLNSITVRRKVSDDSDDESIFGVGKSREKNKKPEVKQKTCLYVHEQLHITKGDMKTTEFGDKFGDLKPKAFGDKGNFFEGRSRGNREKFMPHQRDDSELFDEKFLIPKGPEFQQQFGDKNMCDIKITGGSGKYHHSESIEQCGLSEEIVNNLKKLNYHQLLTIQKVIIPLIQHGKYDIVAHAQTGSGKTAAFMLPIVNRIQQLKRQENIPRNNAKPFALVIAPSKELVQQHYDFARSVAQGTDVLSSFTFGDTPIGDCIRSMKYGCDMFFATMGRLLHFLREGKVVLSDLRYLVLDEADEILAENFFEDLLEVKSQKDINPAYQTLLFSATFSSEARLKLEQVVNKNYIFVQIGQINSAVDTVKQKFIEVTRYQKYELLLGLLQRVATEKEREDKSTWRSVEKTMIFVEHKRQSDLISIKLAQAGFSVIGLNSDRTLKQRYDARLKFIHGVYEILVCTDLGAKGHNFPGVEHVINYDLPEQDQLVYIHRIGRAGRIGNVGRATSFFDAESDFDCRNAKFYVQTLRQAMQCIPKFLADAVESYANQSNALVHSRRRGRNR